MKAELVPTNGDAPIPITKDVTIVGAGDHLVIRSREDWEKRSEMLLATQDDITDSAKETIEAGPAV